MEPAYGKINLSNAEILYGVYKSDKKSPSFNWLVKRWRLFLDCLKRKRRNIALSLLAFIEYLKYHIRIEKEGKTLSKNYLALKWQWQITEICLVK